MVNTTISIRVPRELKERLENLKERIGGKMDPQLIARLVREDREVQRYGKQVCRDYDR